MASIQPRESMWGGGGGGGGGIGPIFSILSSNGPVLKLDGESSLTLLCEWGNIEQCIIFICNQLKMTTLKSPRLGMQYLFHSIQYVVGDLWSGLKAPAEPSCRPI